MELSTLGMALVQCLRYCFKVWAVVALAVVCVKGQYFDTRKIGRNDEKGINAVWSGGDVEDSEQVSFGET